jgi:hypothetical protein
VPRNYVVHKQDLEPKQVTWWGGIPTVTAATAIEQCVATGVPAYLIRQAIERSAPTGLVPAAERARLTELSEAHQAMDERRATKVLLEPDAQTPSFNPESARRFPASGGRWYIDGTSPEA